jgi:hypothetical protein
MSGQKDFLPVRCVAKGGSFNLVATVYGGEEGGPTTQLTVSPAELLHWAVTAAGYSEGFCEALSKRLSKINQRGS